MTVSGLGGGGGSGTGTGTMSCALVPFGHFQDLEAARDFLCPNRRQGSVAAGKESGEFAPRCGGAGGPVWPGPARRGACGSGGGEGRSPRPPRGSLRPCPLFTAGAALTARPGMPAELVTDLLTVPVRARVRRGRVGGNRGWLSARYRYRRDRGP